jgi:hypothetical protein
LRIFSATGSAAAITERLGIEPTNAVEQGQRPRPTAKRVASMSQWSLETVEREGDLAEHLVELLDRVEPVRDRLVALVGNGYQLDWWCSVESIDTERAIELYPELLARLSAFPWPLLIDAWTAEVVPVFVELEVAVPRLMPASR